MFKYCAAIAMVGIISIALFVLAYPVFAGVFGASLGGVIEVAVWMMLTFAGIYIFESKGGELDL